MDDIVGSRECPTWEIPSSNFDAVDPTSPIADNIDWQGESRVITLVVTLSLFGAPEADQERIDFFEKSISF